MENANTDLKLTKSFELMEQGRACIAGFTQSMMKKPEQFALGRFPVYLAAGDGATVTDVDGNQYIDYICGLGANALGHNHPAVVQAISQNLSKGLLHSLPAEIEIKAAQRLIGVIPGGEMTRFFKTGADANSAAVRLARFITNKEHIVTVGYNGWHDQYMFDTPGVPKEVQQYTTRMPLFTPDDEKPLLDLIASKGDQIAAVLLSVPYNRELAPEFVQQLRQSCADKNVLFVIDEVVTGFRLGLGGAQEYFGVQADMVTLSKGLAAGMPLSAVVGSKKLLSQMEKLQVSTTFGGEMLSLEVCHAALGIYKDTSCIGQMTRLGKLLKTGVNAWAQALSSPLRVVGYDAIPMFLFSKNPAEHARMAEPFLAEMAKRGILLRRDVNFICAAHTEDHIQQTVAAVKASLEAMAAAEQTSKSELEDGVTA